MLKSQNLGKNYHLWQCMPKIGLSASFSPQATLWAPLLYMETCPGTNYPSVIYLCKHIANFTDCSSPALAAPVSTIEHV